MYSTQGRSPWWHRIVAKHGLVVKIVQDGLQEWAAFELECDLIALYGRRDVGYGPLVNLSDGGEGATGYVPTPETRAKFSKIHKGKHVSAATREKLRLGRAGFRHTEASKAKMATASTGRKQPPGAIEKRRIAATGKVVSAETKAKLRALWLGTKRTPEDCAKISAGQTGTKRTPEARASIRRSATERTGRPVICNGVLVLPSVAAAVEWATRKQERAGTRASIRKAIARKGTAYGYTWAYATLPVAPTQRMD